MFNIGAGEMIVIALILLMAVGPEQLPGLIRRVGRTVSEVKGMTEGLRSEFMSGLEEIERATDPEAWAAGNEPTKVKPPKTPVGTNPFADNTSAASAELAAGADIANGEAADNGEAAETAADDNDQAAETDGAAEDGASADTAVAEPATEETAPKAVAAETDGDAQDGSTGGSHAFPDADAATVGTDAASTADDGAAVADPTVDAWVAEDQTLDDGAEPEERA